MKTWNLFLDSPQFADYCVDELKVYPSGDGPYAIPWGDICIKLIDTKMDNTLLTAETDNNAVQTASNDLEGIFSDLGPQFSLEELREKRESRRCSVIPPDFIPQEPLPTDPYEKIRQRLRAVEEKIKKTAQNAKSLSAVA